jgi:hypothetical protein
VSFARPSVLRTEGPREAEEGRGDGHGRAIRSLEEPGIDADRARPDKLVGIDPTQLKQPSQQESGKKAETPIASQELAPSSGVGTATAPGTGRG